MYIYTHTYTYLCISHTFINTILKKKVLHVDIHDPCIFILTQKKPGPKLSEIKCELILKYQQCLNFKLTYLQKYKRLWVSLLSLRELSAAKAILSREVFERQMIFIGV